MRGLFSATTGPQPSSAPLFAVRNPQLQLLLCSCHSLGAADGISAFPYRREEPTSLNPPNPSKQLQRDMYSLPTPAPSPPPGHLCLKRPAKLGQPFLGSWTLVQDGGGRTRARFSETSRQPLILTLTPECCWPLRGLLTWDVAVCQGGLGKVWP